MPQMCPNCNHNNRGKQPGKPCSKCGAPLRGLLGFGERVKDYEAQKVLGCGGFSAVYKAKDVKHDRDVAIKELFALDDQDIKRFEHEAAILSRLSHPQLPRFYDHFEHKDKRYLVMEFIRGQSLADIVIEKQERGEKVREVVAFGWALQLCDAVAYLHKESIIHRDVKPDNVRLTPTGEVCLVDLGIAKRISPGAPAVTVVHGLTQGYAPIEQYATRTSKYRGRTDERTDVYAIGATLYTVVTNLIPTDARAMKAETDILPPIQAVHPQISDRFAMTIERAMELMPEDRFASVVDMKRAFTREMPPYPAPGPEQEEKEREEKKRKKKRKKEEESSSFLFADGSEAGNLGDFVAICDKLWEDAKVHLYEGHIEQWAWLPLNGKFGLVTKAREIRENEPNQDVGLDAWLEMAAQVTKVQRERPQIALSVNPPAPVDLGEIVDWDAEVRSIRLRLELRGSRTRRSVVGCAPCLEVSASQIDWPSDGLATLDVSLKPGAALDVGEHPLPEAVWLETDHQKQTIAARVVVKSPVKIEVEPTSLDFGRVDPKHCPMHTLTIRNPGKEKWQGSIETVPWLKASPRQITCDAGDQVSVRASLPKRILRQPGDYQEQAAIVIRVGDDVRSVAARLTVLPQPPIVTVSPEKLDFGQVDSKHCPVRQLGLRYRGEAEWKGGIETVPWLEIQSVAESPSEKGVTEITIVPRLDALSTPRVYEKKKAVTISGEDLVTTVAARLVAAEPALEFSTALIDFGQVADAKTTKSASVKAYNPSLFEWRGTARSTVPWLRIEPESVVCDAGKHASLKTSLTPQLAQLEAGALHQPAAFLVEGMGQKYSLDAQLTFLPPEVSAKVGPLEINPSSADFGQVWDWETAQTQRVTLRNAGTKALHLKFAPKYPWLNVNPRFVKCPAGDHAEVVVSLSKMASRLRVKPYHRPEAITIEGAGETRHLAVDLEIVEPPADTGIVIKPLVVDFGRVSKAENQVQEVRVSNYSRSKWTGRVTWRYPWLECTPAVIECLPERTVVISVHLGQLFARLAAKEYDRPEAIAIRGKEDDRVFHVRVRLQKLK